MGSGKVGTETPSRAAAAMTVQPLAASIGGPSQTTADQVRNRVSGRMSYFPTMSSALMTVISIRAPLRQGAPGGRPRAMSSV